MRAWRVVWLACGWSGVAMLGACSSADAPADGGPIDDSGLDVTALDVAASEGGTCDDCGSPRFTADCTSAEMACLNDVGCATIRNCVFSGEDASAPCALDATGPACVDACIERNCSGAPSVALYRTLDQCAYCTACAGSCSAYCSAFTDAGVACD